MNTQINEQFANTLKPFNALIDINVKAVEKLVNQQAAFVTSFFNDNIAHSRELAAQTDFNTAVESQKTFVETFQAKLTNTVTGAYAVVTETSEEISEFVKGSFVEATKEASKTKKSATKTKK
ncbi:MAG: phasin family protein [Gammaproteobacteria bacterium]|nr:phasin family protein [Gammaproteobacteria bacterium]